jgi:hypothetical protein
MTGRANVGPLVQHAFSINPQENGVWACNRPNIGLQATANSLRSYLAPAIGGA